MKIQSSIKIVELKDHEILRGLLNFIDKKRKISYAMFNINERMDFYEIQYEIP